MGEAELQLQNNSIVIHSTIHCYGEAASHDLSIQVAADIQDHWNEAHALVNFSGKTLSVRFNIKGIFNNALRPENIYKNKDPRNNYFRIEEYAHGDISFVDGLGSNTGYFKLANLLNNSTTAAHEYGHTLGLEHPENLDIRGAGQPGIMYPRGTLVDPMFQYDPSVSAGLKGGTINPFTRKVLQKDIDDLRLPELRYKRGLAVLGAFSNLWHEKQVP